MKGIEMKGIFRVKGGNRATVRRRRWKRIEFSYFVLFHYFICPVHICPGTGQIS